MKQYSITLKLLAILSVAMFGLTSSCYRDQSTGQSIDIPHVFVSQQSAEALQAFYREDFVFAPIFGIQTLVDGVPDSRLFTESDYNAHEFVWTMATTTFPGANPNDHTQVVGEGWPLVMVMNFDVTAGTGYTLLLTMTHKQTQMRHSFTWSVSVSLRGAIGAGLLIAHTHDGLTSDIGFIGSYHYSNALWTTSPVVGTLPDAVNRNLFSERNNGRMIDGLVSQIVWAKRPDTEGEIAVVVREQTYLSLDAPTMMIRAENDQMFALSPQVFRPQWIFTNYTNAHRHRYVALMNDNEIWTYHPEHAGMIMYAPLATDPNFTDFEIQEGIVVPMAAGSHLNALLFDKRHRRIVRLDAPTAPQGPRFGIRALREPADNSTFDPRTHFSDYDAVYATFFHRIHTDPDMRQSSIWLMQNRTTGRLMAYELEVDFPGVDFLPRGVASFDLSGLLSISQATNFLALGGVYRELFYTVDNRLYVVILARGTGAIHNQLVWSAPQGEEITHIIRHIHVDNTGMTFWSREQGVPVLRSSGGGASQSGGNLITIVTYNQTTGEGRVYALPRSNPGAGTIAAPAFRSMWGGFGRITAITQRQRG